MSRDSAEIFRALAEAFNARDWDRARELMDDEIEFIDVAAGETSNGSDEVVGVMQKWAGAFSDLQIQTLAVVADERHAAGEFIGRGTHDGTLPTSGGDIPATGRRFDERFTWFGEIADGKISGLRDYYNAMALMVQLGLMPEPAEAS